MIWICLALAGVAFLIGLPLCALLAYASPRLGLLDPIGTEAHKRHERIVPNTGGIGIFLATVLPMLACLIAVWVLSASTWQNFLPPVADHLDGLRRMTFIGGGIVAAMGLLHLLGLLDDRRALGPYLKLSFQVVVVLGLVLLCDMRVLHVLDQFGLPGLALSTLVSVAWIITIINAFNFLDNMDGLSAGVAAIIAALYLAATLLAGQWFVAALAALLFGALVAFLFLNVPPARLFMGDGGSLIVGLLLAVISIRTTYFEGAAAVPALGYNWYAVLMPLILMAIPLYDFISVVFIRLLQGRSPFRGDHSHFSHRLVAQGLSRRRAVAIIWLCTLATGLSGVMLGTLQRWQALVAVAQCLAVVAVLALLEHGAARAITRQAASAPANEPNEPGPAPPRAVPNDAEQS